MIQNSSILNIIDNSGAKYASCIKVLKGFNSRYAHVGDCVIVSIKSLRVKRRTVSKIKKGQVLKALLIRSIVSSQKFSGDSLSFLKNEAILLTTQNKYLGSRIFGVVPSSFRFTKYLKIVALSSGIC